MGSLEMTGLSALTGIIAGGLDAYRWLLRDEFTDTRAAGAVNGTPAVPGPGTRAVVDVGGALTVDGDWLNIPAGAANQEICSYASQARTAGRLLLCRFERDALAGFHPGFGWCSDVADPNTAGKWDDGILWSAGDVGILSNGAFAPGSVLSGLAANTEYDFCIVLRVTGAYYFWRIPGNSWELLWVSTVDASTPTFPLMYARDQATNFDFIRIPDALWLPTPLAYDTFTRGDGAIGSTEATGPDAQASPVVAWDGGVWTVSSNEAINTPVPTAELLVNGDFSAWTADDPDGWTVAGEAAPDPEVCQVASGQAHAQCGGAGVGSANMYTSGAGLQLTQNVCVVGRFYRLTVTTSAAVAGSISVIDFSPNLVMSVVASYTASPRKRVDTTIRLNRVGATDVTIDDISLKEIPFSQMMAGLEVATADVIASVELDAYTVYHGLGLALNVDDVDDPQNFVLAYFDGSNRWFLTKYVAGVPTDVIEVIAGLAIGGQLVVVKDGTSYSMYYNNAQIGTTQTIADAGIVNNTIHGMFSTYEGNQLDNFLLMPRGNGGEYDRLNIWGRDA